MPKTKKVTKSATSKTKKSLISRFNSLSIRKKSLIITVLVLTGVGTYFTYQSFAATSLGSATIANGQMRLTANSPCSAKAVSDASKNNTKVAVLACPSGAGYASAAVQGGYDTASAFVVKKNYLYRTCASVKGKGKAIIEAVGISKATLKFSKSSYETICSGFQQAKSNAPSNSYPSLIIDAQQQNGSSALVNVSSLWAEEQAPQAPAPSGGGK